MSNAMQNWISEAAVQGRNAIPVAAASAWSWFGANLDVMTKIVLLLYAVLQVAFLLWKWRKEKRAERMASKGVQHGIESD